MDRWGAIELSGFVCAYHSAVAGSNPKHTIYASSIYVVKFCTIFVTVFRKGRKQKQKKFGPFLKNVLTNEI